MQPNILLIHSDQHRYDCVGVNGHPFLQTPNLDRLAAEGMNFSQAFCPIPLCVPARNSLLYGQWTSGHMCIANEGSEAPRPANEGLPTFSQVLNTQGYQLGYVGKWHVHEVKTPLDYGFHDYVPDEAYIQWRTEQGLKPKPHLNTWFGEVDPYIEPEQSRLGWGADHTIRLLDEYSSKDQPFFIRWDPHEPHLPNIVPEPYFSMYPPGKIPPWASFPDPLQDKPYVQKQQRRTWKVEGWTWEQWAPTVAAYLGDISLMDEQIGRVLQALDQYNLTENTLVIYTTDHGDMCGAHGMIDKHYIMYDDVVHIPLIMRWPVVIAPGSQSDAFISGALDLAATFCDVTGAGIPDVFAGQSLLSVMAGDGTIERQDIFSVYHGNQLGLYTQRMVREHEWKYVWNATAVDELYHLPSDPGELRNRIHDSETADHLLRLRQRLLHWMRQTEDLALNAWTEAQIAENLIL